MKKVYMYNIGFFFNLMYEFLYKIFFYWDLKLFIYLSVLRLVENKKKY